MKNEAGFTFISMMLALFILIMIVPLIHLLLTNVRIEPLSSDVKVQQFYLLLRNDFLKAKDVTSNGDIIYLQLETGEIATIERYNELIRRQVQGRGHEIYLRNVKQFQLEELHYGIKTAVTTTEGKTYEKTIAFYE